MRRRAFAGLLAGGLLAGQTPDRPDVTIRTTTRLVEVSVVVHDRSGKPVTGLTRDDFVLTEEGQPREIRTFTEYRADRLAGPGTPLQPNIFSNHLTPQGTLPASVTAVLIDSLNTGYTDQAYAQRQVLKLLQTLRPGERVALYALGRTLRLLHNYTSDASALVERARSLRPDAMVQVRDSQVQDEDLALDQLLLPLGGRDSTNSQMAAMARLFFTTDRVRRTVNSLEAIGRHLAAVPGRKNLVWVSGGFPPLFGIDSLGGAHDPDGRGSLSGFGGTLANYTSELQRAARALNEAGVAIYPVDARGLFVAPSFAASNVATSRMRGGRQLPVTGPDPLAANQIVMADLAQRTGGRAFTNTNDLAGAVRQAIDDGAVTYTLGYYAEAGGQNNRFRKLKVRLREGKYEARYRDGYYATPVLAADEKEARRDLQRAAWSPLEAAAIPLNAHVAPLPGRPEELGVVLQIETGRLMLPAANGRYQGRLDVVYFLRDEQGKGYATEQEELNLNLTPQEYAKAAQAGIIQQRVLPRAKEATTLVILVREAASGALGSLRVPLSKVQPGR